MGPNHRAARLDGPLTDAYAHGRRAIAGPATARTLPRSERAGLDWGRQLVEPRILDSGYWQWSDATQGRARGLRHGWALADGSPCVAAGGNLLSVDLRNGRLRRLFGYDAEIVEYAVGTATVATMLEDGRLYVGDLASGEQRQVASEVGDERYGRLTVVEPGGVAKLSRSSGALICHWLRATCEARIWPVPPESPTRERTLVGVLAGGGILVATGSRLELAACDGSLRPLLDLPSAAGRTAFDPPDITWEPTPAGGMAVLRVRQDLTVFDAEGTVIGRHDAPTWEGRLACLADGRVAARRRGGIGCWGPAPWPDHEQVIASSAAASRPFDMFLPCCAGIFEVMPGMLVTQGRDHTSENVLSFFDLETASLLAQIRTWSALGIGVPRAKTLLVDPAKELGIRGRQSLVLTWLELP